MKIPRNRSEVGTFLRNHSGILIVLALFLAAGTLALNQVLVYTPDSARYLAWARSLSHLEGYRDLTSPMPLKYVVHAPMYPILLAPVAALFPYSVPAAKFVTMLFALAALVGFYWWIRRDFGAAWGVTGSLLLGLNPAFVLYSTQVLSDIPFTLAVIFLFIIVEPSLEGPDSGPRLNLPLLVVGVCCIFLREVGIAVVAATVIYILLMKRPGLAIQLLVTSVVFYLLWYVRNEVAVASIEHPPMRNTQVFLSHMFTPNEAGLLGELVARATNNAAVYAIAAIRLPLMSEIVLRNVSTSSPVQFPIQLVLAFLPVVYKPFVIITCGTILTGMVAEFKRRRRFLFLALVLACYSVPILLYPINDTRFLLPILVILVYFFVAGAGWIGKYLLSRRFTPVGLAVAGSACLFVLLIPNAGWTVTYIGNSFRCRQSPLDFYEHMSKLPSYPELFARPLQLAGEWLDRRAEPSEIIVCRWKELALWTGGEEVLDTDPQSTVDEFDGLLRDYRIRFVVTVYSRGGLREYESQFARSRKFSFETAERIANVEIVRVFHKGGEGPSIATGDSQEVFAGRAQFGRALRLIQDDHPLEAERLLSNLPEQLKRNVPVQMNIGVAKEVEGQLDSAEAIFSRFRVLQQAGSAVQEAWYHQELIANLRAAVTMAPGSGKTEMFHRVALESWNLGLRKQALRFLDSAIVDDHAFFPSLVFKAVCETQVGDTTSARGALKDARRLDPSNILVTGLERILDVKSRLVRTTGPASRDDLQYELASQWQSIGLREEAIDVLLRIQPQSASYLRTLRLLVDIYTEKERYEPARFYLRKLVALKPDDAALRAELRKLEDRW